MKTRNDFVSNSSSSSFVLLGKTFNGQKLLSSLRALYKEKNPALLEELEALGDEEGELEELLNLIDDALSETSFRAEHEYFDDNRVDDIDICIGINPNGIKDDETLGAVKKRIAADMAAKGIDCSPEEVKFVTGGSDASGCSWIGGYG